VPREEPIDHIRLHLHPIACYKKPAARKQGAIRMSIPATAEPMAFILVRDREKAKAFYSGVLGLKLISEDDFAATYDLNGITLRLTTVEDWTPHPHTVVGWSVPDIAATSKALAAKDVVFSIYEGFGQGEHGIWTSPDGKRKLNWFSDPEGNVLSLKER
jgi:catechol 2,3-dioxygenase-like lactoylglutathione lyase family enzyme